MASTIVISEAVEETAVSVCSAKVEVATVLSASSGEIVVADGGDDECDSDALPVVVNISGSQTA